MILSSSDEEAVEQLPRHVVLVAEMIEEAALGDPGRFDQLLDRRRRETLLDDRIIGDVRIFSRVRSPLVCAPDSNCTAGPVFSISLSTIAPHRPSDAA